MCASQAVHRLVPVDEQSPLVERRVHELMKTMTSLRSLNPLKAAGHASTFTPWRERPESAGIFSALKGNVSLSVSVSSNSSLLVEWNSGSKHTTQCALLISTEGRQEIQIHLLPRSGSLLLENMTDEHKHCFLCSCFDQSQGLLCSKNISLVIGGVSTPALVLMSDTQNSASYISMKWLNSGVFGTTLATCVILLIYIIYRRWTGNNGVFRLRLR
ncbi:hypothetical protein R3I93_020845 [Phoxinus phoxinus]|uniref:Uncharacterized protein n=1 Tax=Phoxinus phoxinus TaxID=58324 RepID=A0AAN9GU44_9TELE